MSKQAKDDDDLRDGGVTEIVHAEFEKVAGVGQPANQVPFVLLKSRESDVAFAPIASKQATAKPKPESKFDGNAGRKLSPKARQAFAANAERVRRGGKPKKGKAGKAKRRGIAQPFGMAAKAASMASYSHEIPATGCVGEAASIMASVTGERSSGLCAARTASGTPCMRPAVGGQRCHMHG